jgi:putative restriction endonuclease
MASLNLWSREELILAFNLYLKLPFGKMHSRTPEVVELAGLTGRTSSSIAFRLTNFASCDPYHQQRGVKGMEGGKKQCQPIWDEFFNNQEELIFLSEQIRATFEKTTIEEKFKNLFKDITDLKGETRIREVKTRVNQSVFREIVISNYNQTCAISGIKVPQLLVASHIIPWSKNEKQRLNPENGICLSSLYDKAFDTGLITFDTNYQLKISKYLNEFKLEPNVQKFIFEFEKKEIILPIRFLPNKEFLAYHQEEIFIK